MAPPAIAASPRHGPVVDTQGIVFGRVNGAVSVLLLTRLGHASVQTAGLAILSALTMIPPPFPQGRFGHPAVVAALTGRLAGAGLDVRGVRAGWAQLIFDAVRLAAALALASDHRQNRHVA